MKKIVFIFLFVSTPLFAQPKNIYMSLDGLDSNTGTIISPYATLQKCIYMARPGDTVNIRGGLYMSEDRNDINPIDGIGYSGKRDSIITYRSYPGEWAVFDCSLHCEIFGADSYNSWLSEYYVEFIHFKDMEIKNVFQCQYVNSGVINFTDSRYLEFHNIIIHDISSPRGYWGGSGAWYNHYMDPEYSYLNIPAPYWPTADDTTRFINCDVYNTCDTLGGGNAGDGWKIVQYSGNHWEWIGCRAWNFSDDGWDPNNAQGATQVFKDCWSMATQKYERFDMEGNGFKLTAPGWNTGSLPDDAHFGIFQNCIAVDNNMAYLDNLFSYTGSINTNTLQINTIAYKNSIGYDYFETDTFYNSISWMNDKFQWRLEDERAGGSNNNWNMQTLGIDKVPTAWDFLSLDLGEITRDRKADGSLPDVNLFRLRKGSQFIDAGIIVSGYPVDSAGSVAIKPDIGVWEYVPSTGATDQDILSVTFPHQLGYSVYDYDNHTVTAKIRYEHRALLSNYAPIVLPSDRDTISPGFMAYSNFTSPVTYNVYPIGDNSNPVEWTVTITPGTPSVFADIRDFEVPQKWEYTNTINRTTGVVNVYVPVGENVSNMSPTIDIDLGATISPVSGSAQDFSSGYVDYIVTAEDETTTKNWRIYVDEIKASNSDGKLGYETIFAETLEPTRRGAVHSPFVVGETGDLESISVYLDEGGTGNIMVGVYNTQALPTESMQPYQRLGVSLGVPVRTTEGWQTIDLIDPTHVVAGDTVYLTVVFQGDNKMRILDGQYGNPLMSCYGAVYGTGLPSEINIESNRWNFLSTIYATYDGVYASTETDITSFSLTAQTGSASINTTNHIVNIQVAYGTDITSLSPTIGISGGATISPVSGTARNFITPQTYTVTAEDETTQTWTVTVTIGEEVIPIEDVLVTSGGKFIIYNGTIIRL